MKYPINPTKFLKVLAEIHAGAPYLCVESVQKAPRVWTVETPPESCPPDVVVMCANLEVFKSPPITAEELVHVIQKMAQRSSDVKAFARAEKIRAAARVPGGYIERRLAAGAGAQ